MGELLYFTVRAQKSNGLFGPQGRTHVFIVTSKYPIHVLHIQKLL